MEPQSNAVKCPKCGAEINVSEVLMLQIQEQLKEQYDAQIAQKDEEFKAAEQKLQQEREQLI